MLLWIKLHFGERCGPVGRLKFSTKSEFLFSLCVSRGRDSNKPTVENIRTEVPLPAELPRCSASWVLFLHQPVRSTAGVSGSLLSSGTLETEINEEIWWSIHFHFRLDYFKKKINSWSHETRSHRLQVSYTASNLQPNVWRNFIDTYAVGF